MYLKHQFTSLFLLLLSAQLVAQTDLDSIQKLETVVVTAQFSKQSIKKAVHNVVVISSKEIEQQAGNNLADILNQNLNINITPNAKTGKSQVSLFGLDGQYFKILQDGIPMISEDGFGNNIDLTQINLDDVKQIEIVEGSMGVSYGANAVSGIINIITKSSTRNNWNFAITSQEETIGNEYEWWQKGRHIQSLSITNGSFDNIYLSAHISRNDFLGSLGERKGKNYIENDGLRGYEWLPKEQLTANISAKYSKNDVSVFYKYANFIESVHSYDPTVNRFYNPDMGYYERTALDTDFKVNRHAHKLNIDTKLFKRIGFSFSNAYQTQHRKFRDYTYDLITREADETSFNEYLYRKSFFSKAIFTNFTKEKNYDFQFGLEFTNENGFGSSVASVISTADVTKEMHNFDAFISSEIAVGEKLSLRPGFRYSYQSVFDNQLAYSLNVKYDINKDLIWKSSLGSSFRTPNYDELYTYFVDSNHNVTGNEQLTPENSLSFFTHIKNKWRNNNANTSSKFQIGYINVKDRIDLAIVSTSPLLAYKFINIDKYQSVNFTSETAVKYNGLKLKIGATYYGVSKVLTQVENAKDDFLFTLQLNTNLSYKIEKLNTLVALNIKYNGPESEFVEKTNSTGGTVFVKGTTEAYTLGDFSNKTTFFNKRLEATLGIRNLMNVTTLNSTAINGGVEHTPISYNYLMGYGRSYYLKLKYNLTID